MNNHIEELKIKLKSASKIKLNVEKNLYKAHKRERSISEELTGVRSENEFLKEQIEDMKRQLSHAKHQISKIAICSASTKSNIDASITNLDLHMKGFHQIFEKDRALFDLRMKEIHEKEAEEEEIQRQIEKAKAKKFEQEAKEAATIELECDALVKECTILKKRNNAIMLQLRRKLLETENARRELLKKHTN